MNFFIRVKRIMGEASTYFKREQNGIALVTMIPFMISGVIFPPWGIPEVRTLVELPQIYSPWVSIFLFFLTILTALFTRSIKTIIAAISALLLLVIAINGQGIAAFFYSNGLANTPPVPQTDTLNNNSALDRKTLFFCIYAFTATTSLVLAAWDKTISRTLFRLVIWALLLDVLLFSFFDGTTIIGRLFSSYYPSQLSVLMCLLLLMMIRMVVKLIYENTALRTLVSEVDPRLFRAVLNKTLTLWAPMVVLFLALTLCYNLIGTYLVRQPLIAELNNLENNEDIKIYEDDKKSLEPNVWSDSNPAPDTVEDAAKNAIDRLFEKQKNAITAKIAAETKALGGNKDAIYLATRNAMPNRFPGTKTDRCGFFDIICYIKNGIKSMINSAYVSGRESMLADFKQDLDNGQIAIENNSAAAKAEVSKRAELMSEQAKRRVKETALGLQYLGLVSLSFSFLVLLKSLAIVFARVFYSKAPFVPTITDNDVETEASTKIGTMEVKGSQFELTPIKDEHRFFVTFKACGNNVVDRRRIPQPFSITFKRLFSGNLVMCLVDLRADTQIKACDLIVDPPAQITEWTLLQGEEAFVDMGAVIAFSESCTLGRTISMSIGSLIFGRIFFHSVKGPGRVFLRTESAPLAARDKGTSNIMQSSSLIAWRRDAQFNIVSSLTHVDMYFSGFSIRKAEKRMNTVIYDTSQKRRVGAGGGILKLARAFLLPI